MNVLIMSFVLVYGINQNHDRCVHLSGIHTNPEAYNYWISKANSIDLKQLECNMPSNYISALIGFKDKHSTYEKVYRNESKLRIYGICYIHDIPMKYYLNQQSK